MFNESISMHKVICMEAGWEWKLYRQFGIFYDNIREV